MILAKKGCEDGAIPSKFVRLIEQIKSLEIVPWIRSHEVWYSVIYSSLAKFGPNIINYTVVILSVLVGGEDVHTRNSFFYFFLFLLFIHLNA